MLKWTWKSTAVAILGLASAAWSAAPAPLTSLRAINSITNSEAREALPVDFEATVTYYSKGDIDLFVQDGDLALYVEAAKNANLEPGDHVRVHGHTRNSYRPDVLSDKITVLSHGSLPAAVPANYSQLIHGQLDCRRVIFKAQVRSADLVQYGKLSSIYMNLLTSGGYVDAMVSGSDDAILKELLDSQIEITGVVSGKFDSKTQLTGIVIEVPSLADVKILSRANSNPSSLPLTPMDEILKGYSVHDETKRIRVHGTITYYQPGSAVVLQDGNKSLWISALSEQLVKVGDLADATGYPDARDGSLTLTHAEVQDSRVAAPITPQPVGANELALGAHAFDLISIEGRVLMAVRESDHDEYVLLSGGHLFSAVYRHPDEEAGVPLPPMKEVPVGSRVRFTGVSMVYYSSDPFIAPVGSEILLRAPEDIEIVAGPSMLNVRNLILIAVLLSLVAGVASVRGWRLERRIRRHTAAVAARVEVEAALERRRSRILEDINGGRPLAEILEEIASMTSLTLKGVPCWCEVTDGARLGTRPENPDKCRIVREEVPARSGPAHGVLYVAFDLRKPVGNEESEALSLGARLASLAVETRRLYSDLVRRSEFDLLTGVHNRFSLDRQMEACVGMARDDASNFGLIYIDLDEFKRVNDQFGHRVGDLYLQEVASRMKRQLRAGDMLARLGGDEFVALLPLVGSRAHAEEIAQRLERSFDEQFAVDGYILRGSASVGIALYPEDGTSKDSLLSAADAAMYVTKHTRSQSGEVLGSRRKSGFSTE